LYAKKNDFIAKTEMVLHSKIICQKQKNNRKKANEDFDDWLAEITKREKK